MNEKFLFVWLFLVLVSSFFFCHFWGYSVYVPRVAATLGVVPLLVLSKFAAVIAGFYRSS